MQFANFDTWQRLKSEALTESNPLLDCPMCDGEGYFCEECAHDAPDDECEHDDAEPCEECSGEGQLHYNDINEGVWLLAGHFSWQQYFRELTQTARDVTEFYALDFLGIAGQAIKASH